MSADDTLAAEVDRVLAMADRLKEEEARGWPQGLDIDRVAREWNEILAVLGRAVAAAPPAQQKLLTRVYTQNLDAPALLPPDGAPQGGLF